MFKRILLATTAATALYFTATTTHAADSQRFIFRLPSSGILVAAAGAPVQPGGDGDPSGGSEVEKPAFDGHFDVVEFNFPGAGGWQFQCETGNWHVAADRASRLALLTTYNGAPAVGSVARNGTFTFQSDAFAFTVPSHGPAIVTPGAKLGTWLPPCHEPYLDVHGPLWRVLPIATSGRDFGNAGTPIVTSKRLF
ncbi:hypothetical protein LB543_01205 [Mesorhizobium sp. ESP7-2]|uniref:hypothetical protein n=1 Tax=Mesorhizobium sp. ESP7-2 TaxID=2876622 RepID=UPI001CCBC6E5|nr:hypothetical protein [Mesorhizobium sp. ESP7-2]MBZ9705346.1 hypothetical protein [Mesorhizobium sp. ESP7-2]